MQLSKLLKRPLMLVASMIALLAFGEAHLKISPRDLSQSTDVNAFEIDALIEQLKEPANKVEMGVYSVPGGESLIYSPPMDKLIALGDAAREPLHKRLGDLQSQNEVVLVLGAIGDESTVALLVDAYPDSRVPGEAIDFDKPHPVLLKHICFSNALTRLTHEPISRSRWGTDASPENRKKWQDWWARNQKVFWVAGEGGGWMTFIPVPRHSPRTLRSLEQILAQLDKALEDLDSNVRAAAAKQLGRLGPNAKASVPNLITTLGDANAEVRAEAADAFFNIGPEGEAAIPALLNALRKDRVRKVRSRSAYSLAKIGEKSTPYLLEELKSQDVEIRQLAAGALGTIQPPQKVAFPALLSASKDNNPFVRVNALSSMSRIASEDPDVFGSLLAGLDDPAPEVRSCCARHFERMGTRAAPSYGRLSELLSDKDSEVQLAAIEALTKLSAYTPEHVPSLIVLLKDKKWEVRSSAAEALRTLGPRAKGAIEPLREGLRDPQACVRWWSAMALEKIGPDAKSAVPDLLVALKDREDLVQRSARDALKQIDMNAATRAGL